MEIHETHRYDHGVDRVFAQFVDPATVKAKQEAAGSRHVEVQVSGEGDERLVLVTREVPADVPAVLKTFLGAWNRVDIEEHWKKDGESWRGKQSIHVAKAPLKISCVFHLRPEGGGSVVEVKVTLRSHVPLVGKKLVALAAQSTRHAIAEEYRHVTSTLATLG
ncbi:MAG: DUF2505 domain-containing protein [Deltaproteobacteria bacterium]|nr:DUF2505 domain-containing protein [Deltaproteobacteria bacterium]